MASFPASLTNLMVRKRPGFNDSATHSQPLDLSVPKQKVRHHWSGGSIVEVNEIISTPATSCVQFNTKLGPTTFFTLCSLPSSTLADSRSDAPKQQQQQQHSFLIQFPLLPQVAAPDLKFAAPSGCKRNRISKSMEEAAVENEMQRLRANQHHLHLSGYYYANLPRKEAVQLLQNTLVGTFLLRDSSDSCSVFALSIQTEAGPTSVRIQYVDGEFRLDASSSCVASYLPRFRSVPELVDFYVSKWRSCKERGQVWLDNRGNMHSDIILKRPVIRSVPTLQHLCRLSWNRSMRSFRPDEVPLRIQSFLREYPFHS